MEMSLKLSPGRPFSAPLVFVVVVVVILTGGSTWTSVGPLSPLLQAI